MAAGGGRGVPVRGGVPSGAARREAAQDGSAGTPGGVAV